ncbi:ATP-binding protein [Candidatus Poriferisodalis sp.]|uniref:ATP-binding protein n=1 Tax=Candidatus Poriferisodalis sp. TaxID=3101277 RepID=UPI003B51D6CC
MAQAGLAAFAAKWDPLELAEVPRELRWAQEKGETFHLDLSEEASPDLGNPSAVRLYIPSVMALANLLVGCFRDVPVTIRLPASRGLNLQLARGGFFYALANRGPVRWLDGVPSEWDDTKIAWAQSFHPDDSEMLREALVCVRDLEQESWVIRAAFQRYLLSVIHPHHRPASSLHRELSLVAGRWLSGRLGVKPGSEMRRTLADCLEVFYQIVVNVPDHAALRRNRSGCSLGQVYATLGGGRESYNRLHFSVIDNGVGLPSRVNDLYGDRKRSAEDSVRDAVMGRLPRRTGGRGIGLNLVREIASEYRAGDRGVGGASRICIVTQGDSTDSATVLDWHSGGEVPEVSTVPYLPIRGTLVWVSLGLDRRTPDDDPHQLELTFAEAVT